MVQFLNLHPLTRKRPFSPAPLRDRKNAPLVSLNAVDLLFIFFDAGETLALTPLLEKCAELCIPYQVLALGTAASLIAKQNHLKKQLISFPFLLPRKRDSRPPIVITGMASRWQLQLAKQLKEQGSLIVGYYDAFHPLQLNQIGGQFLPLLDQLLLPTLSLACETRSLYPRLPLYAVGQPCLEEWQKKAQLYSSSNPFSSPFWLNANKDKGPFFTYLGGWGADYPESFSLFLDLAKSLKNHRVLLSLHPKCSGALEKKIIAAKKVSNLILLPKEVSSFEASLAAEAIFTHRSTAGVQAAFMGKPVFYLENTPSNYTNIALQKGLAIKLPNPDSFSQKSLPLFPTHQGDLFQAASIPQNSVELLTQHISKLVKKNT